MAEFRNDDEQLHIQIRKALDAKGKVTMGTVEELKRLADLGRTASSCFDVVAWRLSAKDSGVRLQAVHTVAQIVAKGDQNAIADVRGSIDDQSEDIRIAAMQAFDQIAEQGNPHIIS